MRPLLAVLGLAWIAVVAATWEMGRRAEDAYRAQVEALGAEARLEVTVERYDRGVFGSEAETSVRSDEPADPEAPAARLVLHHRIDHGPYPFSYVRSDDFDGRPVLARAVTRPRIELETAEAIEEIALPLAIGSLFTRSDGATLWMVPSPDHAETVDPELSADWENVYAETGFAYDGSSISGEVEVPRVAFDGETGSFQLAGLFYEFAYDRISEVAPLYVGGSHLRLGRLAVAGKGGSFSLRDLEIEDSSHMSDGSWSLQVDGSLGALEGERGPWGSGEMTLRMAGLALEPLSELAALGETLRREGPASDAVQAELQVATEQLWPRILAPGPVIELSRLRLDTPEGEIRMALRFGVDTSEPGFLAHPMTSLPALELDADLSLPRAVLEGWLATPRPVALDDEPAPGWAMPAEAASQRVEAWLDRGYIERREDRYELSIRVRKGAVRMNGRVVSLDAL